MKKLFILILGLYLVLFFLMTFATPLLADDYGFRLMSLGGSNVVFDAFQVAINYYLIWGGRSIAHFFTYVMMWSYSDAIGFFFYGIANTLVFSVVVYCSYLIVIPTVEKSSNTKENFDRIWKSLSPVSMFTVALLVLLMTVNAKYHYQTIIWATGAAHYLWMYLILMVTLVRTKDFFLGEKNQVWSPIDYLLFILVGLSYENVGVSLCALLVFRFSMRIWKNIRLKQAIQWPRKNEFIPFFLILVSAITMLSAPGNQLRDKVAHPQGTGTIIMKLQWWFESLLIFFGRPEGLFVLLVAGALLFIYRKFRKESLSEIVFKTKEIVNLGLLFCIMTAAYVGHTGNFYGRKSFNLGWIFCLLVVSLLIRSGLSEAISNIKMRTLHSVIVLMLLLSCSRWAYDAYAIKKFARQVESREKQILSEKSQGKLKIKTYAIENPFDLEDLSEDPSSWINAPYAKLLGVEEISVEKATP